MTEKEAIQLFKEIQNGRGVYDFYEDFPWKGSCAEWTSEFSLGAEYGMLFALKDIFNICEEDLRNASCNS